MTHNHDCLFDDFIKAEGVQMNLPTPALRTIIAYVCQCTFSVLFHVRRKGWLSTTYPRVLYFMALASNSKRKGGCYSDSAFILLQRFGASPLPVVISPLLLSHTPITIITISKSIQKRLRSTFR